MPAKYKLVLRKDMRKDAAEGSKLYYASANTTGTCDVYELRPDLGPVHRLFGRCETDPRRIGQRDAPQPRQRRGCQSRRARQLPVAVRQHRHADREGVQPCAYQKPPHRLPPRQAAERCDQELHVREDRFRCSRRGQRRGRR